MNSKLSNLKRLYSQIDNKGEFVQFVADECKLSYGHVLNRWFQSKWKIPEDQLDTMISYAQKWIFKQTEHKRKILLETGFSFSENVNN
ncbi:hypothetical protein [Wenyingzhuangia sp. 2_MG-2023]|uniref:hypothetical protein n=1 Tax=Wenyingzhuangia sp. 2_MG-2023 TaxID=3062639 RepID=UPI0026E28D64|nr:hypothetical protein [Wenyingzhuangia sp. 2_MG-2023]MDO6737138.1 hypothetical protein [Wenyingzhuangia sp. 2_MG-2023]